MSFPQVSGRRHHIGSALVRCPLVQEVVACVQVCGWGGQVPEVHRRLRGPPQWVWAAPDGAVDPAKTPKCAQNSSEPCCLFWGDVALLGAGPVCVSRQSRGTLDLTSCPAPEFL